MASSYKPAGVNLIMASFAFNVWLENRLIDTVFYDAPTKTIAEKIDYVKRSLIVHGGYDPAIRVTWPKGQRRTENVYELHGDYGQGFELLCAETSRREALQRKREYMENAPCPLKIVKKLERK